MKKGKKIVLIVFDVIAVLLILWFVLGYVNFGRISNNEKPWLVVREKTYEKDEGTVHVYDNIIYKVVKYESDKIIYSIKLWFMEDV